MTSIDEHTSLLEVATRVSEALRTAGIAAPLAGGAAVSVHTENRYQTRDLDFVTSAGNAQLAAALQGLGFSHHGRPTVSVFRHPDTRWYLEFPRGPLVFGDRVMSLDSYETLTMPFGELCVITPTQSVLDRLSSAVHWNDAVAWDQAALVAGACRVDWQDVRRWLEEEGEGDRYARVRERLRRAGA